MSKPTPSVSGPSQVSFGFRIYVQNFGSYTAFYGAIGAVIVLMLWLHLSGFALLIGAELNAEIDRRWPVDTARQGPDYKKKFGPTAERSRFVTDKPLT